MGLLISQLVFPRGPLYGPWITQLPINQFWGFNGVILYGVTVINPAVSIIYDLPRAYPRADQTWTWQYNLNLIGQDVIPGPPGRAYYDRPPPVNWYRSWELNLQQNTLVPFPIGENVFDLPPRDYQRILESWTWQYNLNLIGQDRLPTGKQITDLPPRSYPRPDETWISVYNLNLIGQDQVPGFRQIYDLSPRGYPRPDATWTNSYNLNLIGQDVVPGKQFTDRPPPVQWYRSIELGLVNLLTVPPSTLPNFTGQVTDIPPRDYQRIIEGWTWNYNPNLIGQDVVPGKQFTERPPPVNWYRDWALNLVTTTLFVSNTPNVIASTDLPPRDYQRIIEGWTWNYNLNLIGQDVVPGKQYTDRPPPVNWYREWALNLQQSTLQPIPYGKFIYDLPPRDFGRILESWALNLQQSTLQPIPYGANVTDLPPRDYQRILESWTWAYNLNLIGQDALPKGMQYTDRPPPVNWYRSAELNLLQSTLGIQFPPGAIFFDLPPRDYQRFVILGANYYNLNLIGKDVLPADGRRIFDLTPPLPPRLEQTIGLNLALNLPTPQMPPAILHSGIVTARPPERPLPLPAIAWFNNPILALLPTFNPAPANRPLFTLPPNTPITQFWLGRSK